MATTLSNGYILPTNRDRGSVWFPALESNIQRTNDHTHNGANSEKLTPAAIEVSTDTILPAAWSLQANGLYRALVTMPGALTYDTKHITLKTNDAPLYGELEKVTANTFYVYVNDNSLTVTVVYV